MNRMQNRGRVISCLMAVVVALSTFGVWLQHPGEAKADFNCAQCYGKIHWTGDRNSFAGSYTRAKTPGRKLGVPTKQYYGSWLWDDVAGAFITVGVLYEINIDTREGTFYYFGQQRSGLPYEEYVDPNMVRNTGYGNALQLHRDWANPYNQFYGSYYELGANDSTSVPGALQNAIIFYNPLQPTRASIGMDVRGNNMSLLDNGWYNNLYILNDGSYYPHRGMQNYDSISYPPIACYWRPAPTDYNSIGGNLECEAP